MMSGCKVTTFFYHYIISDKFCIILSLATRRNSRTFAFENFFTLLQTSEKGAFPLRFVKKLLPLH